MRCNVPYIPDRTFENDKSSINESKNIFKTNVNDLSENNKNEFKLVYSNPTKGLKLEYYKYLIILLITLLIYITTR